MTGRRQDGGLRRGDRRVARRRAAGARPRAGDRPRPAAGRSAAGRPRCPGRPRPLGPGRRGAGRRVAADPGGRLSTSWSGRGWRSCAPLADVGLVIVDEEHDPAYKSDRTPRLQARDSRDRGSAELAGAAVVLGSATPAVDSSGGRSTAGIDRIVLPTRPVGRGAARSIVVDLRAELAAGNRGLISDALDGALAPLDTERGRAGHPRAEPARHRVRRAVPRLRARPGLPGLRAAARLPPGRRHPALPSLRPGHAAGHALSGLRIPAHPLPGRRHGAGRARGARAATRPCASLRLDRDIAERRGAATRVIDAFSAGAADVLVGTSLVAKGLDVPVGDPRRRRVERCRPEPARRACRRADLPAAQPGGRPGRVAATVPGRAILQTYQPDHPAIRAVADGDATSSTAPELDLRRRFGSPPYGRVDQADGRPGGARGRGARGVEMADRLRSADRASSAAGRWRGPPWPGRHLPTSRGATIAGATTWSSARRRPAAHPDRDPGPPWSVDVDPESLL